LDGHSCDGSQNSDCIQKWYARINVGENCDISGVYTFQDDLMCRDSGSADDVIACPDFATPVQFTMQIKETDLCNADVVSATEQLTTSLIPYSANYGKEATIFKTGDTVYWKLTVNNPQATISKIEFEQIMIDNGVTDASVADVLYNSGAVTGKGTAALLQVAPVETIVPAGHDATLTFQYGYYQSALPNTVGSVTGGSDLSLRTTVVINIWYHGNQKRTTMKIEKGVEKEGEELSLRGDGLPSYTLAKDHTVLVVVTDNNNNNNNNNNNAGVENDVKGNNSVFTSPAGVLLLMCVLGVVAF